MTLPPITARTQFIDPKTGLVTAQFIDFWQQVTSAISAAQSTANSANTLAGSLLSVKQQPAIANISGSATLVQAVTAINLIITELTASKVLA